MPALLAYSDRPEPILEDAVVPALAPGDVRIQVAAAAVNPVDTLVATGGLRKFLDLPDPVGLGWDVSGTVTEVGAEVERLSPGERVAGMLPLSRRPTVGTHAVQTVLSADAVAAIPDGLDVAEAASLPLNALSAEQALALLGPAAGRTLLITGGAGALGGHAVTLAGLAGWRVTALARATDAEFVARAGGALVTELPGPSFDAVLDAAALGEPALGAVRDGGAFAGVAPAAPVAPARDITVRTLAVEPDAEMLARLLALAAEGVLEPRIAGRVPLTEAAVAYDAVAAGGVRGRWLLIP
jgi:NADPH:quinone reductase-like Zn-dependent oxidoreductase